MVWRLIYDAKSVVDLFETSDITVTRFSIFDSENINDCFDLILNLQFDFEFVYDNKRYVFIGGIQTIEDVIN
jgi:hypothetical protein